MSKNVVAALCAAAVLLSAGTSRAVNQFLESFTTETYKDAARTTADWNTGAGQLRMFPFASSLVGRCDTPGAAYGVVVAGALAFVADNAAGLQIISISNPASPILVGTYDTPGYAWDVAVDGDLAFVADYAAGLQVINIKNPAAPTLVGSYNTPGAARRVVVTGNLVFVADYDAGLQIISITNPATPSLVGNYNTPQYACDVAVAGNLAFVADGAGGLKIIDFTTPSSPTLKGSYDASGLIGIAVAGDVAFAACYSAGLKLINVSNPASPTLVGSYDTPGLAYDVAVAGDIAFVADAGSGTGLHILNVTNPASPTLVSTYVTPGFAQGVAAAGNRAFVADDASGLEIVKVGDPLTGPTVIGTYGTSGYAEDVAVAGDLVFVADRSYGLRVVSIANPAGPTLVGGYSTPSDPTSVAVNGDLAFLTNKSSGLRIIDTTNPASPTLLGRFDTPGDAMDVAVAGHLVFVADGWSGLEIISIANPASPVLVGNCGQPGLDYYSTLALAGDLVYAQSSSGLHIIDVTSPLSPTILLDFSDVAPAASVVVSGDLAFVGTGAGLKIVDITNPLSPSVVGSYPTGRIWTMAVDGDLLYVNSPDAYGFRVLDVSNPASPQLVGSYEAMLSGLSIAMAGERALWATYNGVRVVQVLQHEFDSSRNVGRSLVVDGGESVIRRARLSTTQTQGVSWEVSANNGGNWEAITANPPWQVWTVLAAPGSDLLWRSTHAWAASGVNPAVSDLRLEWLFDAPVIGAILDVSNDQGGQATLKWRRSSHDFADDATPIVQYAVYRKRGAALSPQPSVSSTVAGSNEVAGGIMMQDAGWDLVTTVSAALTDDYMVPVSVPVAPAFTTFRVTALTATPGVFFDSPPDSGYSIDNLAPAAPANFAIAYNSGGGNALSWNPAPEPDFENFRVYRSTDPGFTPSPGTLVHTTTLLSWVDLAHRGGGVYYKLTATDVSGNESGPASPGSVTAAGGSVLPKTFALYSNVPNPFNPITRIRFDVPENGGEVSLRIYDVSGRLVKTLVSGAQSAGAKSLVWHGRDDAGRPVASGVYFYTLVANGFSQTEKMVLLK